MSRLTQHGGAVLNCQSNDALTSRGGPASLDFVQGGQAADEGVASPETKGGSDEDSDGCSSAVSRNGGLRGPACRRGQAGSERQWRAKIAGAGPAPDRRAGNQGRRDSQGVPA